MLLQFLKWVGMREKCGCWQTMHTAHRDVIRFLPFSLKLEQLSTAIEFFAVCFETLGKPCVTKKGVYGFFCETFLGGAFSDGTMT